MATAPGAPTGLTASAWLAAGTGLTLSWTAPIMTGTTNGTTPTTIASYTITYATNAGFTTPSTITAVTGLSRAITGLTAGTNYWFRVNAVASITGLAGANSSAVATATLAAAPTIGAVSVASATSVTVNWTAPTNNSGITSYTVTPFIGVTAQTATTGLTGTSATITGLTQGTSYTFTVRAVTAQGTSNASAASAAIVPSTAPGAATSLVATPATTSIALSWSAPASNGGGALVVNYKIERSIDGVNWSTLVASQTLRTYTNSVIANSLPIPVAGTNYWYRVTSFNIPTTGATQSSSPTDALATATLAAAPTIGAVSVASVNSINVAWTGPAGNPGITSYTVTPFIGTTAQTATTGLSSSPATITGLTKGTAYTFKVAAVTAGGTGAVSASSAAATPSTAPSAAMNLTATPTITSIALSWTAPSDTGGLTVNYKIERSLDNSTWATLVASQTAITFTNSVIVNAQPALVAGTNYWYRVTPFNTTASGSTTDALATNTLPAAPTAVTAVSTSNTSASVSFVAPAGNTTKSYTITPFIGAVAQTATTLVTASPVAITGLTNGTTYTFKVVAVSNAGSSAVATSVAFLMAMVPDQVASVTATPMVGSTTSVTLNWPAAPANNGAALTYYRVERSSDSGATWVIVSSTISAAVLTYAVGSLTTNLVYQFRVSALNAKGAGAPSAVVTSSSLPATPTGAPTVAVTGPNTANITFTSIAGLSYTIVPLLSGSSAQTAISVGPATGVSTTAPVTLSNSYGCYKFKVQAVNSYGVSAAYGANSAMAYFASSVAAPGGNAYVYDSASYVIGTSTVSYTATLMANATIAPTSVGGTPGWSVTAGGATDTLIGVKRIVFSDQSAYLFGSGSAGSIDSMNNLSATVQAAGAGTPGGKSGDVFLFSRGETYTRNNVSEWYIDLSGIAIKGVGDSSLAKPILVFNNTAGWPAHITQFVDGVTLQDLQISGGNKTRSFSLFKVTGENLPIGLKKNITFTGVDFINVGSKSIDFHYVHGITMTGCTFGAATNDKTLSFTSCHDVVMANCTVERSAWNSVSIMTSDGPNYLWTNNTSTLWSATEAERLDALNNKNFDFSTSTFNSDASGNLPLIIMDLHRVVSSGYPRAGLSANVTNLADPTSHYQVSMSYSGASPDLKLPASMSVAYSGVAAAYTSFDSPVSRITSSTSYSSALLRDSQWPPAAYPVVQVRAIPSGERLYPDGFPRTPAEVIADQEELLAAAAASGTTTLPVEVDGSQVEAAFVEKEDLESDTVVAEAEEGAPLLVKDGEELIPAIKTDVSVDPYESTDADAKVTAAMEKAINNEMTDIVVIRIRPGDEEATTTMMPVGTMTDDLIVETTDSSKSMTLELTSATYEDGSPMPAGTTAATAEIWPRTDGVAGTRIYIKVGVNGVPITSGFNIPLKIEDPSAAGATGYTLEHYDGTAWVQMMVLTPVDSATAGNNYTFEGELIENQDYRGTPVQPAVPVCFLANAPVLTPRGYRRIDSLKVGDLVRLADGRSMEIKKVKVVRYEPSAAVNPFVIPKGSFGAKERLLISPSHRVAVPGRGMVEARNLGLKQWTMHKAFDYYNLELEKWDNMVVAGVEVESLAPVRRTIITTAQLKQLLRAKFGAHVSESELLSKIPSSFFSLGNGLVSIPYIKK